MLPEKFEWLNTIGPLPKMLAIALQYYGIKEIPGMASNPIIMGMAKDLGVDNIYTNDDESWCALAMNDLIKKAGKPMLDTLGNPYNLLRAKELARWGNPVEKGKEKLADTVILSRPGGYHTTLWIAETEKGFWGYGGNQSNSFKFSEFLADRIVAVRNYYSIAAPASAKHYKMDSSGQFSSDEK